MAWKGGESVAVLKKRNVIQKRNVLNEIRSNSMTIQELRFFSIYLSKINAKDIGTRVVRFPINDFKSIMELGRIDINYMKNVTNSLLCKIVNVPDERGGYTGFQLFKECTVSQDDSGEWYVEIDAHDKALPLMFEFKSHYFTYQLWNALRLRSSNQLRMYEILKQYEKIGSRVVTIDALKNLLGIGKSEYPRFGDFKNRVLDACKEALTEHTDIKFTYEPYGKKGTGGKILNLIFFIERNEDYTDQLTLDEFIAEQVEESNIVLSPYNERIDLLVGACDNEFSADEVSVLYEKMLEFLPDEILSDGLRCYHYLRQKYKEMVMRSNKTNISHRFGYVKGIIVPEVSQ